MSSLLTLRPLAFTPSRIYLHRHLSTSLARSRPANPSSSGSSTSSETTNPLTAATETISETFNSLADKFRKAVEYSRSEQYEGVEEGGLRMLVFGKPGSGKGTLSARLVKDYDIAFVSTGDVLRKEIAAKSEVGRKAEQVVATGGLVSDELMLEIVKAELDRLRGKSWIVDGFPRTLHQGELLDKVLNEENRPLNMIVHLNVPDSVIMARISARWVHLPSGRVYNTTYSAPKVPGKDDVTGEPLSKRPDDTPETFSKRLQAYYESTAPLLQYFSKTYPDSLFSLSGSSSDEVLIAAGLKSPPPMDEKSDQNSFSTSSTIITTSPAAGSSIVPALTPTMKTNSKTIDLTAVEKLWPQLQALIEPFGLRRDKEHEKSDEDVDPVRKEADDLRDPGEVRDIVGKK
ncbi:hypothetical protein IAR55_005952 [Kwoniella newhampshirensis]|uniref:Adenylate kinase active site lid domain-containing protein n=1 Tax=Kwoniella newhampshirensis TaxID=1651941 RepID=A0AAW0YH78_9TREE